MGSNSPINAGFFSIEPDIQIVLDVKQLFNFGNWEYNKGWENYGTFQFDSFDYMRSFNDPNANWKKTDDKYPYLPLLLYPTKENHKTWSNWNTYGSWCEQGMMLYYLHFVRNITNWIDPFDLTHEMIHFVIQI